MWAFKVVFEEEKKVLHTGQVFDAIGSGAKAVEVLPLGCPEAAPNFTTNLYFLAEGGCVWQLEEASTSNKPWGSLALLLAVGVALLVMGESDPLHPPAASSFWFHCAPFASWGLVLLEEPTTTW